MDNEDMIRKDMEGTRTSLTEKLETLEQKVADSVGGATEAVTDTVEAIKDSVKDTVAAVKETVKDTVATVKEKVHDGAQAVQDWFDVSAHIQEHPWIAMGGSMALGYFLGALLGKSTAASAPPPPPSPSAKERPSRNGGMQHPRMTAEPPSSTTSALSDLGPELGKLKSLAIGTLLGTARELILKAVPKNVGEHLKEIFDNVTKKVGGDTIPSSDWAEKPQETQGHEKEGESHGNSQEQKPSIA